MTTLQGQIGPKLNPATDPVASIILNAAHMPTHN